MAILRLPSLALPLIISSIVVGVGSSLASSERLNANRVDQGNEKAITDWLAKSAIVLKTVDPGNDTADLRPLKKVFQDVRIVGLGEGTHGSSEFFRLKHRLIEFLVRELGFTVFSIESGYGPCLQVNDYVVHGTGDAGKALAGLAAWPWDTREVRDLIEWMRQYNQGVSEEKRVKFLGFDLDSDRRHREIVVTYLKRVAPEWAEAADSTLKDALGDPDYDFDLRVATFNRGKLSADNLKENQIRGRVQQLVELFKKHRDEFIRKTSASEFSRVEIYLRTVPQLDEISTRPWVNATQPMNSGIAVRDVYMSENIQRMLDTEPPGTRMIVWAHNGHVATGDLAPSVPSMGSYLRQKFGSSYYAMGLIFNQGSFQARNLNPADPEYGATREFTVGPASTANVESVFARSRIERYIVDLRSSPESGAVASWLRSPAVIRHTLGAGFSLTWSESMYSQSIKLRDYYDGIAFIDKTTRAQPNPTGVMPPMRRNR